MRVRLLVDVELSVEQTTELSEAATTQPVVLVELPQPLGQNGGRLMGAQHVEAVA